MSLTISIPDGFADVLGVSAEERDRKVREALALELYREGEVTLRRRNPVDETSLRRIVRQDDLVRLPPAAHRESASHIDPHRCAGIPGRGA